MNDLLFNPVSTKKARVEIIPLIDVVFFLLATFVLFVLSLDKVWVLNRQLPISGIPKIGEDHTLYLASSEEGFFIWKEGAHSSSELITLKEMAPRLADYRRRIATPQVVVGGDDKAKFGAMVKVLDEVRLADIHQVSIGTLPSEYGF